MEKKRYGKQQECGKEVKVDSEMEVNDQEKRSIKKT